jgi:uncharacterized membrane protein
MSDERGERRLPVVVALLVAMALPILMPANFTLGPVWLIPVVEGMLLIAMLIADPGRIDRRSKGVRAVRITIVVVLVLGASWATIRLVDDIVTGGAETNAASSLLQAGSLVWINLVIAFGFLFWELDAGGPAERAHESQRYPDLAFAQHVNPGLAPPEWRPLFSDYLYLGLTNGLAFSPTDVMPLTGWAKLAMSVESLASLAILGLVIARAVNILA